MTESVAPVRLDPDDRRRPDRGIQIRDVAEHLRDVRCAGPADGRDRTVTGISDDSRTVQPGDLYVALPGDRFHGLDFDADAAARGAVSARPAHSAGPLTPEPGRVGPTHYPIARS